jgi:hypothetical protein
MRLTKKQREAVIAWVAEGLETDEINKRAATFKPPFSMIRQQVDWYRKTRKVVLKEIVAQGQLSALATGLALKEVRVSKLERLAERMERDLGIADEVGGQPADEEDDRLWVKDKKGVGSGPIAEIIDYEKFNDAEVNQYRGVLDDIAKEMGHRKQGVEVTGADGKDIVVQVIRGVSMDDL